MCIVAALTCTSGWAFGITKLIGSVLRYPCKFGSTKNYYRSVPSKTGNRAKSVSIISDRFWYLPKEPNKLQKHIRNRMQWKLPSLSPSSVLKSLNRGQKPNFSVSVFFGSVLDNFGSVLDFRFLVLGNQSTQ